MLSNHAKGRAGDTALPNLQASLGSDSVGSSRQLPGLQGRDFGALLVDPPWPYETYSEKGQGRSASQHYPVMSIEQIKALPLAAHAARDSWLFLWCPTPSTHLIAEVMAAWGWEFSGLAFCWVKTNQSATVLPNAVIAGPETKGAFHFGLGKTTRKNVELSWLGRRGRPRRRSGRVRDLIIAPVREHSRKPDDVYARIEQFCSGPYLELFARQRRPGWTAWGDQVDLFNGGES